MKKMTTIRIDPEILRKAHELGINISKACENSLRILIQAIENAQSPKKETGGVGFEPTTTSLGEAEIDWDEFLRFMQGRSKSEYAKYCVSYAKKYAHCLLKRDFSEVRGLPKTVRGNVLRALSNLAKFLGIYSEFKRLKEEFSIKWVGKSTDEIIIDRLTKVVDPNELFNWIREVKRMNPDFEDFLDLMAITGLRLSEAIECYNLIIKLSKEGKLCEYYNEERETLEHFKFKEIFLRRNKKVFISFVPKELVERIASNRKLIKSRYQVEKRIQKQGYKIRYTDIRELHGSFLTKYLMQPEIDFLHGRTSASIFMQNYFNPAWISDLKERTFKAIVEIQNKIS